MFQRSLLTFFKAPTTFFKPQCGAGGGDGLLQSLRALSIKQDDVIKPPRTPYMIFSNDRMPQLIKSNPGMGVPAMGKMLGQMWREMSEEEKNAFRDRYRQEKEDFSKQQSGEGRVLRLQERRDKMIKKALKKLKLRRKEQGKPAASGLNPYLLFATSKMIERGDASLQMYIQGVSDIWKKMTEEDKRPFIERARKNSVEYQRQLWRWEERMIQAGEEALLSKTKLKKHQAPLAKASGVKTKRVVTGKGGEEGGEKAVGKSKTVSDDKAKK